MPETVTLEFIAVQQRRILDEMSSLRTHFGVMQDDIRVLSAMAIRQDNTTKALVERIDRTNEEIHRVNVEMHGIKERLTAIETHIQ